MPARAIDLATFPRVFVSVETDNARKLAQLRQVALEQGVGIQIDYPFLLDFGYDAARELVDQGLPVLFDARLYCRPQSAMQAARGITRLGVSAITAHLAGGPGMIEATRAGIRRGAKAKQKRPALLGLTAPTHMHDDLMAQCGRQAVDVENRAAVQWLDEAALCDGLVCAGPDVSAIKATQESALPIFVAGAGTRSKALTDHHRTLPAHEALDAGADHLIIGRQITAERSMSKAVRDTVSYIAHPSLDAATLF